jgi:hypothetical protein
MSKIGWSEQELAVSAESLSLHLFKLAGSPPKLAANRRAPPTFPSTNRDCSVGHLPSCPPAFHEMTMTDPMSSSRLLSGVAVTVSATGEGAGGARATIGRIAWG